MEKVVYQQIDCVMECSFESCCRSINYKKTTSFQNEPNCEMLHNMAYNTSENLLEKISSYDHVYLETPEKVQKFINELYYYYYIHFEIRVVLCKLLGSYQCDFSKNRTLNGELGQNKIFSHEAWLKCQQSNFKASGKTERRHE